MITAAAAATTTTRTRRSYDHRLRGLVHHSGDAQLVSELDIPRSTTRSWIRRSPRPVVSLDLSDLDGLQVQDEVLKLRQRSATLRALLRLLFALLRCLDLRLDGVRLPDGPKKDRLLRAIDRAGAQLPLGLVLKLLGLSPSRYHAWKHRQAGCELADRSSCPRSTPSGLTPDEVSAIGEMVSGQQYRHMSITALARHAQRIGRVFASAATWCRLVKVRGWQRPRRRVYPAKPKLGIRAERPNQYFHIDVTVLKLLDGTRTYLHAVIDNFSRRILAWKLAEQLEPASTCQVLCEAARQAGIIEPSDAAPTVIADSGVENVNGQVAALIDAGLFQRVLAQVEVSFSNSMIEAFWRSLRHQWLYLHSLDSIAQLRHLVAFYVQQHNQVMPHSAFQGQTPDEMYFGTGDDVPARLAAAHAEARAARLKANQEMSCDVCKAGPASG